MLEIRNPYADRDITVMARNIRTGQDGASTTIPAGETATIEIDGHNQIVLSTRAPEPGEIPMTAPPVASLLPPTDGNFDDLDDPFEFTGGGDDSLGGESSEDTVHGGQGDDSLGGDNGDDTLSGSAGDDAVVASDEQVRDVLAAMKTEATHLTKTGLPELPEVNARLAAQNLAPIKADRRDALFAELG